MSSANWNAVDDYIVETLVDDDPALSRALAANAAGGLPAIDVSAAQGKLLHLLARIQGATRVLEIGTLGGYSTIWLARALPAGGEIVTLELSQHNADVARANLEAAGVAPVVDIRVGPALETLPVLAAEDPEAFDLVFIDADKPNTPEYFRWALRMTKPGSVIIADNVVRNGALGDPDSTDPGILGARELFEQIAADPGVTATAIQTVGSKGHDGFAIALVLDPRGRDEL